MKKMTATERLLAADKGSLKRQRKTKEYHSPSLSELLGEECYITVAAVEDDLFTEISQRVADDNDNYNSDDMTVDVTVNCVIEPDFHDEKIYSRFAGAITPEDAVKEAFSARERISIADAAVGLAGEEISEKDVEEVKN